MKKPKLSVGTQMRHMRTKIKCLEDALAKLEDRHKKYVTESDARLREARRRTLPVVPGYAEINFLPICVVKFETKETVKPITSWCGISTTVVSKAAFEVTVLCDMEDPPLLTRLAPSDKKVAV